MKEPEKKEILSSSTDIEKSSLARSSIKRFLADGFRIHFLWAVSFMFMMLVVYIGADQVGGGSRPSMF